MDLRASCLLGFVEIVMFVEMLENTATVDFLLLRDISSKLFHFRQGNIKLYIVSCSLEY